MRIVKSLALVIALVLCAGTAVAGCGHKDTVEGKLKSVDAETHVAVVVGEDGKEVELTLTAKTHVTDAKGKKAEVSKLVGKEVKVVSEHGKVDTIQQIA